MRTRASLFLGLCLILGLLFAAGQATAQTTVKRGHDKVEPEPVDGALRIKARDRVEALFSKMVVTDDITEDCPVGAAAWLFDQPLSEDETWGCLSLTNTDGETGIWRVDFDGILGSGFTLWMVRGDEDYQILTAPSDRTLNDLETGGPWLSSLPFPILPGDTVELWVKLDPLVSARPGPSRPAPSLVPEEDYDDARGWRQSSVALLVGASGTLILFFAAFARLLDSKPARRYALYFLFATLYFVSYQGAFAALVPSWPVTYALLPNKLTEIAMVVLYFRFVGAFVETAIGPHRIVRVIRWLQWLLPASFFLGALVYATGHAFALKASVDGSAVNQGAETLGGLVRDRVLYVQATFMGLSWLAISLWSATLLVQRKAEGAWAFAVGAIVVLLPYYAPLVAIAVGQELNEGLLFSRGMTVVDGLIFAAAMVRQTFALRAQRNAAVEAELAASQEKLRLSETLVATRQDLSRAEGLAERHRSRLALTSHDLHQPLTSLQLAAAEAESPALRDKLTASLSYLTEVLQGALVEARADAPAAARGQTLESEPVPLAVILQNVVRMFGDEAAAKGLSLRLAPTEAVAYAAPVALIRSLSNLVSNAVKYTESGGVLIGVRRRAGGLSIAVYDTGAGLMSEEITAIRQSYTRGATAAGTAGEGIGLAGVEAAANEHGWRLEITSRPGRGSCFELAGLVEAVETEEEARYLDPLPNR